jgi:hypothetical protein
MIVPRVLVFQVTANEDGTSLLVLCQSVKKIEHQCWCMSTKILNFLSGLRIEETNSSFAILIPSCFSMRSSCISYIVHAICKYPCFDFYCYLFSCTVSFGSVEVQLLRITWVLTWNGFWMHRLLRIVSICRRLIRVMTLGAEGNYSMPNKSRKAISNFILVVDSRHLLL